VKCVSVERDCKRGEEGGGKSKPIRGTRGASGWGATGQGARCLNARGDVKTRKQEEGGSGHILCLEERQRKSGTEKCIQGTAAGKRLSSLTKIIGERTGKNAEGEY